MCSIYTKNLTIQRSQGFVWMRKAKSCWSRIRRPLWPLEPGVIAKEDYEYRRAGTRNLFVAIEPKGGRRLFHGNGPADQSRFCPFCGDIGESCLCRSQENPLGVLDNLNTHFRGSFVVALGEEKAVEMLERIEFHYTPKHASWLNMAEIKIGVLERQCTGRRIGTESVLQSEVSAWERRRNEAKEMIEWKFTRQDADKKIVPSLCFVINVLLY